MRLSLAFLAVAAAVHHPGHVLQQLSEHHRASGAKGPLTLPLKAKKTVRQMDFFSNRTRTLDFSNSIRVFSKSGGKYAGIKVSKLEMERCSEETLAALSTQHTDGNYIVVKDYMDAQYTCEVEIGYGFEPMRLCFHLFRLCKPHLMCFISLYPPPLF